MNTPALSYILPAYNCAALVTRCLDSIYGTGLGEEEFEVIVTDDCSTDDTVEVLQQYASQHSNMTVLKHDRNRRQGAARNTGLKVARGRYLTFVDCDDEVTASMADALKEACDGDFDIYCGVSWAGLLDSPDSFKPFKILSDLPENSTWSGFEFCSRIKDFCGNNGTPWGYLFKAEMVKENGRIFIEDHLFEETDWIAYQFLHAKTIFYSSKLIYRYISCPDSVSNRNMGINYVVDSNKLACRMMRLVEGYREQHPDFVEAWNNYADKNLISKGLRWRFLIQYKAHDILKYYRDLGDEDLKYLAKNYSGSIERTFYFRHRIMATAFLISICTANAIQRKLRGMGPARTNFYS